MASTQCFESVDDLAERTGLSRSFWRQRVFAREIPFYKIGRSVRFDPAEVDDWIAARKVEPSAEADPGA